MKKFLAFLPMLIVVLVVAKIAADNFRAREFLGSQIKNFEAEVEKHEKTGTPYNGELDSIVIERNKILAHERFIMIGTWDSGMGTDFVLYLDASPLPQFLWVEINRIFTVGVMTSAFDFLLVAFLIILPMACLFSAGFVSWVILREAMFGGKGR